MTRKRKYKAKNTPKKNKRSRHHIIPTSRGGTSDLENIAFVNGKKHEAYHTMFANQRPEEIVKTLVDNYWNGDWNYVKQAYGGNFDG